MHIDCHGHHILLFQDHAESKAQTEELETLSGKIDTGIDKEINVGAAYLMVIGKGNQRSSEKEECNWKTNYHETNRGCIAPSTEVGVLAGNMDVGTDKPNHVIGEYEHDKVVGEGNQDTFQIKEQYQKNDIDEDDLAEIWKEMAMATECSKVSTSDSSEHSKILIIDFVPNFP